MTRSAGLEAADGYLLRCCAGCHAVDGACYPLLCANLSLAELRLQLRLQLGAEQLDLILANRV